MKVFWRILGALQALAILWGWKHASLEVPGLRNPSLAGTFVALSLFEFPWLWLGAPAVILTTRHIPIITLAICSTWAFFWRGWDV